LLFGRLGKLIGVFWEMRTQACIILEHPPGLDRT
jgi:hypothetical protein